MGRKALDSPGQSKEDWWITNELGKRMGLNWKYKHPKEIYEEMSLTMPSLNNISWERLENENSVTFQVYLQLHQEMKLFLVINFQTKMVKVNLFQLVLLHQMKYPIKNLR